MEQELNTLREKFVQDLFVSQGLGAVIDEAHYGYAKCSMEIEPRHCNALGIPMGGTIFTLADFAFAVASNQRGRAVVTQASQITFLKSARGKHLTAEAHQVKDGKRVVIIRNQDYPNKAAFIRDLRANGYRVDPKKVKPFDVFNYICDHTDMNPWDWDLKKVPEEPTAPQEEQVEEAQEAPKAAAEETSGSKLNPMCEKCANYPTDCAGTHEQVWTGCIHCETAHDENRTFSPKKLRTLTDDQLLTAWESTEHLKDPQCPTIRGWLMDEIERRYPVDFNAWLDQDAPEDSQLRHYVMGRGVSKDDVQNHVYKAL